MRMTVDTRMRCFGGIGTYVRCLLPFLEQKCTVKQLNSTAPIYSIREQFDFFLKIPPCDLFWSPHFNSALLPIKAKKHVVTIHDLYHLDHLETLSLVKQFYAKTVLRKVISRVDQILTVSEFSKGRLLHYFPEAKEKLNVIYSGCDHLLSVEPTPVKNVPSKFYLFVGNNKPHKNEAFVRECVDKMGRHLVSVGHGLAPVTEGELCWLYKHAQGLIFPSLYEGFGLPPLEAMALGCPVWASDIEPVREICGNAAVYFDPTNPESLCDALMESDSLIEKGKQRAAQFSWEESARKHFQVFQQQGEFSALSLSSQ
ncbi:MAG: D-inositol-3-phosphate glycosyltransferase [Chlamydiae bacterium]|nr:D-inositol-3-phosphate glycosyltransferase [Chlamydiota bacterium]